MLETVTSSPSPKIPFSQLDLELPEATSEQLMLGSANYKAALPFPFAIIDNFLSPETIRKAADDFPQPSSGQWLEYRHFNTKKLGQNKRDLIPPSLLRIIEMLNSDEFMAKLRVLTGIPNLIADPHLEGGGLHQIARGGFLNIHADFTSHTKEKNWARRVNLLLYLNDEWLPEYGGDLELWDRGMQRCEAKIAPILNRCVIFNTDTDTFHGHPLPLTSPEGKTRKSIALYYFTPEKDKPLARSTEYRSRPQDGTVKSTMIFLDKLALRTYDFGRRRLGISDAAVSKILRFFR